MKSKSTWERIVETACSQLRGGWMLIPITVGLTIVILRIGLVTCCLAVLILAGVLWARRYRVTIQRKNDE